MTTDNRYQFQPLYIKTYRWLRYKPVYFVYGICLVVKWICTGMKVMNYGEGFPAGRKETLRIIWQVNKSNCEYNMKAYWTTAELISQLREKQVSEISP